MSDTKSSPSPRSSRPSPWKSGSLIAAIIITVLGLALWGYAAATRPAHVKGAPAGAVSGFASGDPLASGAPAPREERVIDTASPAVARFGGCFVAGFCMAYAFKKFIKVTAILAGVFLLALFALQRAGVINMEWAWFESGIERSVAWLKGEAGAMKDFIVGYLPSTASALAGMVVGLRRG
jgi:uncharacterized membrane protein (Fun14 family)